MSTKDREKKGGEVEQKGGWVMTVSRVTTGGTERKKVTLLLCAKSLSAY